MTLRLSPYFALGAAVTLAFLLAPAIAAAHVKWFAPFIIDAAPAPVSRTLSDPYFWVAIALVLAAFLGTRFAERIPVGGAAIYALDKMTEGLWRHLDDCVKVVFAAFFVAIFAMGGIYLTPDLHTTAAWVSWLQLLIALGIGSRRTMKLSAGGIVVLWVLALLDYGLFHLLDYLAIGLAVAAYLVLESSDRNEWRRHRFEVLRWGVAIALMWSSLEKFAFPDWFYPLVEEKPFLTFGLPRDMFIPMAGVAEFTLGFGLLATALIRRLSAIALFVIFNAAVIPFGRIDLVGHALIMAMIAVIAIDHTRELHFWSRIRRSFIGVPLGLASAACLFATAYWGLHTGIYGSNVNVTARQAETAPHSTHTYSAEHPHGPLPNATRFRPSRGGPMTFAEAYSAQMMEMHEMMSRGLKHTDPDIAFVAGMIPHHQGAIDMARILLELGSDPENMVLAEHIISEQSKEIDMMRTWLAARGVTPPDS